MLEYHIEATVSATTQSAVNKKSCYCSSLMFVLLFFSSSLLHRPPPYADAPRRWKTSCECVAASTPVIALRADSRDTDSPRRQRASCQGKANCEHGVRIAECAGELRAHPREGVRTEMALPRHELLCAGMGMQQSAWRIGMWKHRKHDLPGTSRSTPSRRGAGR